MSILAKFIGRLNKTAESHGVTITVFKRLCSEVKGAQNEPGKVEKFRILRVKPPAPDKKEKRTSRTRFVHKVFSVKEATYREDMDWTNIWVGPKSFDPYMVPLPIRQGYHEKRVPSEKYGNAELMKIPNFLHLTPPAIKKHCEALKKFCTPWPENLTTETEMERHFPITISASDYCHSSPSIRDPLSRIITLKIHIDSLKLNKFAKDKFLRLVGNRYNPETGYVVLIGENCPIKKQNYDHLMYILTALCFETWRIEEWEKLKAIEDMADYCFNLRKTKTNLMSYYEYSRQPAPSLKNVGSILEEYIERNKEEECVNELKEEVLRLLNIKKFQSDE